MIENKTILCFASGYDAPPTSKHHVMRLLAERNVVLWVNYHASRAPRASAADLSAVAAKLRQFRQGLKTPLANLHVLTPLVLPLPGSNLARRLNRALLARQIRSALRKVARGPVQVWSFAPDIAYLLGRFGEERVVYYCVDDFSHFTGYDTAQVLRDEAALCRRADLVVTTSQVLQDAKAPLNPNTILVSHGVDHAHFARAVTEDLRAPADLAGIAPPRLGFFGLIRDWVDLDMLAAIARRRPAWHFVLLGDSDVDLAPYRATPNLHFLGRKPYGDLPAYCRHFDAGLIPFKTNALTAAVNPIKLREYLAAGLPVISSPMPEVRPRDGLIEVAASADEFEAAIAKVLASGGLRTARSASVANETWPAKLDLICERLKGRL